MAFAHSSHGAILKLSETYTLPSSATTEYSSVIDANKNVGPDFRNNNRYVTFTLNASAVSGTNLDIALYACDSDGSNPVLLLDAVVADITATGLVAGVVDLNHYPAQFYVIGWTSDVDESANTIDLQVFG